MDHSKKAIQNIDEKHAGMVAKKFNTMSDEKNTATELPKKNSVIELPQPTDEQLEGYGLNSHPREHCVASWQLMQIQRLLWDLADSAPLGNRMKLSFKSQSHTGTGETTILDAEVDYNRWLLASTGSF